MAQTKSIGTTGRDYSTIQAWHDAFATGGWIGECYNDSEFTITTQINLTGKSTSATDFMTLRTVAGQSFRDHANKQTNALRYNVANGVGVRKTTGYDAMLAISEDYVTVSGLQLKHDGTSVSQGSVYQPTGSYTNGILENCILEERLWWSSGIMRNCIVVVTNTNSADGIIIGYNPPIFVNVNVVRPSDVTAAGAAFAMAAGNTATIKNCAGFGFTNFSSSGSPAGSNNSSDTTIGFGTSNQASKTYANQFQTITPTASRDFRAKAGADLVNNGVTDTTNIPAAVDIVGTARPQGASWDIGAWELVVAASGITKSLDGPFAGPFVGALGA